MTPDPVAILSPLFGSHTASLISFLALMGYIITWIAPLLPVPVEGSSVTWRFTYAAVNKIAGNVGHARNGK